MAGGEEKELDRREKALQPSLSFDDGLAQAAHTLSTLVVLGLAFGFDCSACSANRFTVS